MSRKYDAPQPTKSVAPPQSPGQIVAMQSLRILATGVAAMLAAALPASASSSTWHDSEGGRIRLVTSGQPDQAGRLHGVLDIVLKPGWKTYWRDPGDSGVPPQFDVSASTNVSHASLSFPAPRRHADSYGLWSGYDHSVSLPVVFTLTSPGSATAIDAHVFLGVCETICIPVQATLTVDPASDPDNVDDAALVKAAFAALPAMPDAGFEARPLPGDHETLMVEAVAPGDPTSVDFFVAGGDAYMFGPPVRSENNGKVTFKVPILDRPTATPTGGGLHYTLTSAGGAVQGLLPYP
jgi:DsbC/DsbD-like thiol-disulfide interchange protein